MTQSQVFCRSSTNQAKPASRKQKTKAGRRGNNEDVNSRLEDTLLRIVPGRKQEGRRASRDVPDVCCSSWSLSTILYSMCMYLLDFLAQSQGLGEYHYGHLIDRGTGVQ